MTGTRGASKASSRPGPADRQQSLLHFYKKSKPSNDDAKTSKVADVGIDPSESEPHAVHREWATDPLRSVQTETKQRQGSGKTAFGIVEKPQVLLSGETRPRRGKTTIDVPDDSAVRDVPNRSPPELALDSSNEQSLVDGPRPPPKGPEVDSQNKLPPRELYPIFKRRLVHPPSPQSSTGRMKPLLNQRVPLPVAEPQGESDVKEGIAEPDDIRNLIDLTGSPNRDEPNTFDVATVADLHGPIIVIDDEPESHGSQAAPIDLCSPRPQKILPAKPTHPIFSRRAVKRAQNDDIDTSKSITSHQMQTPWPSAETQHTRGPQSCFWPSSPSPFPRYRAAPPVWFSSQPSLRFLKNHSVNSHSVSHCPGFSPKVHLSTPLEREEIISSMPSSHRRHAAISRLLRVEPASHRKAEDGAVWTHKWRPRSAAEVLGNEDNLRYMKEWLHALELRADQTLDERADAPVGTGAKRPPVIRAVDRKRGRKRRKVDSDDGSDLDDWIVHDDEEEEEEEETVTGCASDEDPLSCHSSPSKYKIHMSPMNTRRKEDAMSPSLPEEGRPTEFSYLTNTILLSGPPGSGKTSAVYACAEELGWEVFEVYPGIGRRSGANVSSLVGDVGRNHLVGRRKGNDGKAKNVPLQSFISPGFGFLAEDHETGAKYQDGHRAVRQSAILLEEVDVLFKEDVNFWPAVVNIIKSSHRPVFMTCNDTSLVPQDDLPLQAILAFQPCPPSLAVSFLQSVCLAEGRIVPRQQLDDMYAMTHEPIGPDQPDEPQIPFPSQQPACPDLRSVLNDLQFWCQGEGSAKGGDAVTETGNGQADKLLTNLGQSSVEALVDWSRSLVPLGSNAEEIRPQGNEIFRMWHHSEDASYVDGYLERRSADVLDACSIDRYEPSADDEIGHALLAKPKAEEDCKSLSFCSWDEAISRAALVKSRHMFETIGEGPRVRRLLGNGRGATLDSGSLVRRRAENQTQVVSYLDDVIPLSAPLLPRAAAVVEYAAYMREMVWMEDEGRRGERYRELRLSEAGLEGARRTRL